MSKSFLPKDPGANREWLLVDAAGKPLGRLAASRLRSPAAVKKLFDAVVPAMDGRPGGYTRIVKTGTRRGDAAEMAIIELV